MKQHITEQQLDELSEKGKRELAKWFVKWMESKDTYCPNHEYKLNDKEFLPLLSIGQMIEFLDEKNSLFEFHYFDLFIVEDYGTDGKEWLKPKDWCDSLWEAVKKELNEKS